MYPPNRCFLSNYSRFSRNWFSSRMRPCASWLKTTIKASDAKQQQIYSRLWCSEGFVNKTDDYADDSPLDEVSRSLSQSEFQPDVQVHVVVQHKCANHEKANENAEARTLRSARSALMVHCENYGDNQDRYESSAESDWHNLHHFFLRPEYGRVLVAFFDKTWHQPKH